MRVRQALARCERRGRRGRLELVERSERLRSRSGRAVETLVAEVRITGPGELVPVFRLPGGDDGVHDGQVGTPGGTRTRTRALLRRLPLPLGYGGEGASQRPQRSQASPTAGGRPQ